MINTEYLIRDLNKVRELSPLIHNITNYVVMNNTANALLAIGASPVMSHSIDEVEDMVQLASSLVINIGTLDSQWVESMLLAGRTALKKNIPVIFDPVGAGATPFRTKVSKRILVECRPSVIRGNASEIMALADTDSKTKGVDSTDSSELAIDSAKSLAAQTGAVVVISGQTDYITDGVYLDMVTNGAPLMEKVTGMGCTATAIIGAFAGVNTNMYEAALHGMAVMGISGELAAKKASGNGSMQVLFLDELYNINESIINNNIKL
jgi:hydroxyethylthiazole kinase